MLRETGESAPPTGEPSDAGTTGAAIHALRTEEENRALGFTIAIAIVAGAAFAFVPFLPGPRWLRAADGVAKVAIVGAALWAHRRARRGAYDDLTALAFGLVCVTGVTVIGYYLGVFSPTVLAVTTGIAFFSLGANPRIAIAIPATVTLLWLATALLVVAGAIPDVGLVRASELAPASRLFFLFMVPIVIGVTAYQARHSRRATLRAIDRSNRAVREMLLGQARLHEAQRELDQVRAAGVGHAGRHSGARAGRFVLGVVVGRGAMGEVYQASDPGTGEPAAVKVLHAALQGREDLVERFLREGNAAARVRSPHVVRLFGAGELATGVPYLAMEFLSGMDLAALLRAQPFLDLELVVGILGDVCRGLAAVHAQGIVHRDIKPANLFRAEAAGADPVWKILDFGVAKAATDSTLTHHGLIGTPDYMAPEQARGHALDARADVFSLGAVAYRALTGQMPFSAADVPSLLHRILHGAPPRPRSLRPDMPSDIDLALAIALAKRPEDRFASAPDLAAALALAARGELPAELRSAARRLIRALPWSDEGDPAE